MVDVQSHVYTPRYMEMLRHRVQVPRIFKHQNEDRLLVLDGEEGAPTSLG